MQLKEQERVLKLCSKGQTAGGHGFWNQLWSGFELKPHSMSVNSAVSRPECTDVPLHALLSNHMLFKVLKEDIQSSEAVPIFANRVS